MRKNTLKKIERIVDSKKREEDKMIKSLESFIEDLQRTVNDFKDLESQSPTAEIRSFFHDLVEEEVKHLEDLLEKLNALKLINKK